VQNLQILPNLSHHTLRNHTAETHVDGRQGIDLLVVSGRGLGYLPSPSGALGRHDDVDGCDGQRLRDEKERDVVEDEEEVFACHGSIEETFALQSDARERQEIVGAVGEPSWLMGVGGDASAASKADPFWSSADARDVKAAKAGLPPMDPVESLAQQAADLVILSFDIP
jgi:hypothetical protein